MKLLKVKLTGLICCSKIWCQVTLFRSDDFKISLEVKVKLEDSRNKVAFEPLWNLYQNRWFQWNSNSFAHYSKSVRLTVNFRHTTALQNTLQYFIKSPKASAKSIKKWLKRSKVKRKEREGKKKKIKTCSGRRPDVRVENRWGILKIIARVRSCLVRAFFPTEEQ